MESTIDFQPFALQPRDDPPMAVFTNAPPTHIPTHHAQNNAFVFCAVAVHAIFIVFIAALFVIVLVKRRCGKKVSDEELGEAEAEELRGLSRYRYESFPPVVVERRIWFK